MNNSRHNRFLRTTVATLGSLGMLLGATTGCGGANETAATTGPGGSTSSGGSGGATASAYRSTTAPTTVSHVSTGGTGTAVSSTPTVGGGGASNQTQPNLGGATSRAITVVGGTSSGGSSSGGMSNQTQPNLGGATSRATTVVGGSSSGGSSGGAGGATAYSSAATAFVSTYVDPYCTRLATCCATAGLKVPSQAACRNQELNYYVSALNDGTATVNATGVSALLASIQSTCDQPSYALSANLTAGTLPAGAACSDSAQCAGSSVVCEIPTNLTIGKCVVASRGKLGDACLVTCDNTSSCRWTVMGTTSTATAACWNEDGLRCGDADTCVAISAVGQSCDSFVDCGAHANCYNGLCRANGKQGESCANYNSCESTLICDSKTMTCVKMSIAWTGSCEAP